MKRKKSKYYSYKGKACWVARETKHGWRLKLSVGADDYPIGGLLIKNRDGVDKVTTDLNVVFVEMAK